MKTTAKDKLGLIMLMLMPIFMMSMVGFMHACFKRDWDIEAIIHTFRYVHLADAYFPEIPQKYYTRVTSTIQEGESLVQQGFELVGKEESGCLWRKPKTFEDIVRERERELSVKSEFSSEKIL